jgi:hypothetical protein
VAVTTADVAGGRDEALGVGRGAEPQAATISIVPARATRRITL